MDLKEFFMSELIYKILCQDFTGVFINPGLKDLKFERFKRPESVACCFPPNQKNPPKFPFR